MTTKSLAATVLGTAAATLAALAVAMPSAHAATGIHVSGTNIVEGNGNSFVIRGTSHAHTWYASHTEAFAGIKSLGANTVRVVLSGGRWTANGASDVANVISLCKANKLICVLEDHDTTGYGDDSAAYTLDQAVNYWKSIKSVLDGQENYIIIDIGNEPFGNNSPSSWTTATTNAVKAMRSAGFQHALMVDAPNWGQDNQGVMKSNAASVEAADTQRNTIFSVHMYGQYTTASSVTSYVSAFRSAGLPLVIGEFGFKDNYGDVDEATVMAQSIGWMGWSWSGNSSDVAYLDQVNNFDKNSLTSWGQELFNGTNGIKSTSREATVYSGVQPTTTTTSRTTTTSTTTRTSTTSTTTRTTSSSGGTLGCSAAYSVQSQWSGGFVANVTVTAGSTAIHAWKVSLTLPSGAAVSSLWNGVASGSSGTVTVTNQSYNGSLSAGQSTSFGLQGTGTGAGATASCTAS